MYANLDLILVLTERGLLLERASRGHSAILKDTGTSSLEQFRRMAIPNIRKLSEGLRRLRKG